MPVATVVKKKASKTCMGCNGNVGADASKCPNCGSSEMKKSLLIIRKAESVPDSPGTEAPEIQESDLEDAVEQDEEGTEEDDDTDSEEEEDDDDSEDEEDDEDDEEEEADDVPQIKKSQLPTIANETALLMLTAADEIIKAATKNNIAKMDEEVTLLANALDAALDTWGKGETITKATDPMDPAMRSKLQAKLKSLKAQAAAMQDGSDDDEDDDMSKAVSKKKRVIRKSEQFELPPEIEKRLAQADALVEKAAVDKYEALAKSLGKTGDEVVSVGKTLRFLEESNPDAFKVVKEQFAAAYEIEKSSSIFTTFGGVGAGATGNNPAEAIAKALREKDSALTPEQAIAKAYAENPALYDDAIAR